MNIISAFFNGIIYTFSQLSPVSFSGHEGLLRYTQMDLTKGGYDSILPLLTYFCVLIGLGYFLRRDLCSLAKTAGSLLKNIRTEKINLNTDDENEKFLFMVIAGSLVLVVTPLFEVIFRGMKSNLIVMAIGFILSCVFIYSAENVKDRTLKDSNHTILNAIIVSVFRMFCVFPGISGLGGMYFAGVVTGFKREFSVKFAYVITFVWTLFSFLRSITDIIKGINVHYSVLFYIFAFLGALGASGFSIYLFKEAVTKRKTKYYAIYNIIIAVIVCVIWIRG